VGFVEDDEWNQAPMPLAESQDIVAAAIPGPAGADLPDDVRLWLTDALDEGESVHACLLADILPSGDFGERVSRRTSLLKGG